MSEGFPGVPASDGLSGKKSKGWGREVRAALVILVVLFIAWHVVPALVVRDNPPLACQLDGGHWSPWSGWTCS